MADGTLASDSTGSTLLTPLRDGLAAMEIACTPEQLRQLARFLSLLARWNRAYNLTAVRDPAEMVTMHVLDSASALPFIAGESVLDVGSGAGLPGIPLAVLDPGRRYTLLDSAGKKLRFLHHAIAEIRAGNLRVVEARAENYRPAAAFDTVICRAFASLGGFLRRCGSLAAPGGRLLAMKGRYPSDELAALPPGWRATRVLPLVVPGLDAQRHMVVLERKA